MTSTPVKDVGSLLNFVGNQGTAASGIKAGNTGGFDSVMSKASYSDTGSSSQNQLKADKSTGLNEKSVNQPSKHKEVLNADSSESPAKADEVTAKAEQAVNEAGNEMIRETAKELGVCEEDVVDAMEELGFGMAALLDADNLTQLALVLSGEENSLVLLTDESLYGKVQNLVQSLDEIKQGIMEEFSMNPEEFEQMLTAMSTEEISESKAAESGLELPVPETEGIEKPQPKITVTVEENTQSVRLTADENGNTVRVEEVTPKEETENQNSSKGEKNAESGRDGKEFETGTPSLAPLFKNQTQNVEAVLEQLETPAST
ncbi:MAG: hypothetical protein ACI4ED_00005, partial [Suilimivivens sp.]